MRRGNLGGGEWVAVGYVTLMLGTLVSGFAGADEWPEIVLSFLVAFLLALVLGRLIALIEPRNRIPGE